MKHCRDCRNPIGPGHTWCWECKKKRLDSLLDLRLNAMARPVTEHYLPALDRMIEITRANGPAAGQMKEPANV
jgi:hypothetical protein